MSKQQNIYESPTSDISVDNPNVKPGWILNILAIFLVLMNFGISFIPAFLESNNFSYLVGSGLGALILAGIIVGLFQIGKLFRNSRSRVIVLNVVLGIFLLSGIFNFATFLVTKGIV